MALGRTLMALGQWFETRFPEKVTAAEVNAKIVTLEAAQADLGRREAIDAQVIRELVGRVAELERKADSFNSDINKTKVMLLTQRQTR